LSPKPKLFNDNLTKQLSHSAENLERFSKKNTLGQIIPLVAGVNV